MQSFMQSFMQSGPVLLTTYNHFVSQQKKKIKRECSNFSKEYKKFNNY